MIDNAHGNAGYYHDLLEGNKKDEHERRFPSLHVCPDDKITESLQ